MRRREFLKQSAAGAAITILGRAGLPAGAAETTAKVALVRTEDRAQGVAAALKLISFPSPSGKKVLIKPNFNTADTPPGSTHNDVLRQLVQEMKSRGAARFAVGDSCGPGNTKAVMDTKGIPALGQEIGFDVINFDDLPADGWVHCMPPNSHWKNGFNLAKPVVEAEYLLWTCCLKTHQFGGVHSMSLKLAVGVVEKKVRFPEMHASQDHMRHMIAELNYGFKPQLIVMDGVDIFVDGGPMSGKPAKPGIIVAGTDRIAIDAVGLAVLKNHGANDAIMSKKIFEQEQLARAVELGIGIKSPGQIEIVTADAEGRAYADKLRSILAQG
ncbi:MAG TPA: DUF362 domain-containing protein [Acidobacteriota bacterium]|nr:DUF362 domain-containing protein [Acidobacteriota bacterium]